MKYDDKKHITTEELAKLLRIPMMSVPGHLSDESAPRAIGRAVVDGRRQRYYDRIEVAGWLSALREGKKVEKPKSQGASISRRPTVPPADWDLMARREYMPKGRLADNLARAAEVYPHRLYTPAGIGNAKQFAADFERGR